MGGRVHKVFEQNREKLDRLAERLLEHEEISGNQAPEVAGIDALKARRDVERGQEEGAAGGTLPRAFESVGFLGFLRWTCGKKSGMAEDLRPLHSLTQAYRIKI